MSSYEGDGLGGDDPFAWFKASFERAAAQESFDSSRAALATVSATGQPSVRFVLVKQADEQGFVFFTNYESRKSRELRDNPRAALAFHWAATGEQVRVEGSVLRLSDAESDAYFASRPRGSQLGAWASAQSAPIAARSELTAKLERVRERYPEPAVVPRPAHWGGFRLVPSLIEFWLDRRDRMHERIAFTREGSRWLRTRLQP
jgi:pyridoxamine 5'-phosphate oxidase